MKIDVLVGFTSRWQSVKRHVNMGAATAGPVGVGSYVSSVGSAAMRPRSPWAIEQARVALELPRRSR